MKAQSYRAGWSNNNPEPCRLCGRVVRGRHDCPNRPKRKDRTVELHNEAGEMVATNTYTRTCQTCDGEVSVVEGIEQPHECD